MMRSDSTGAGNLARSIASRHLHWLLTTSALCTAALLVFGGSALAFDIDSGDVETVIGTGGGTQTSPWVLAEVLVVGVSSDGTLIISGGGAVSNTIGLIGLDGTGTGTVTVTGAGSTWTSSRPLSVGLQGTGTLTIADGGAVSNGHGFIGKEAGSTGTVTVTGANSTWTNSLDLFVGEAGVGTLSSASWKPN